MWYLTQKKISEQINSRQKIYFLRRTLGEAPGDYQKAKVVHAFKKEKQENLGNSSLTLTSWKPFPNT